MKHLKFAAALVLVVCLVAMTGCQAAKQESAQEQVDKYEALESVDKFKSTIGEHLETMTGYCSLDNPGSVQDIAKAQANLELVCDALTAETNVPEKCKEMHEQYKEAANQIEEAAEYLTKANIGLNCKDYTEYTYEMKKATACTDKASKAIDNVKSIREELLKSDEGQ